MKSLLLLLSLLSTISFSCANESENNTRCKRVKIAVQDCTYKHFDKFATSLKNMCEQEFVDFIYEFKQNQCGLKEGVIIYTLEGALQNQIDQGRRRRETSGFPEKKTKITKSHAKHIFKNIVIN